MKRHGWLVVVVLVALLLAACGPQMATPTVKVPDASATPVAATGAAAETPEVETSPPGELPVDPDDWHALGSPDAPVTVLEYSDFQ